MKQRISFDFYSRKSCFLQNQKKKKEKSEFSFHFPFGIFISLEEVFFTMAIRGAELKEKNQEKIFFWNLKGNDISDCPNKRGDKFISLLRKCLTFLSAFFRSCDFVNIFKILYRQFKI